MFHSIWKYNSLLLFTVFILALASCRKGGEPIPKFQSEQSTPDLINDDVVPPVFSKTDGESIPKDPDEDGGGTVVGGDDGEDDDGGGTVTGGDGEGFDGGGIFDDVPPVGEGDLPKKVPGSEG